MLINFADRVNRTPWLRHLLFLGTALLAILLVGYHFGSFDQAIHIPFLKIKADPTLFPDDPFFNMRFLHYSYFWYIFLPFYRMGVLEIAMFVVHVATTYLAFWGLWTLSKELFDDPLAALLSLGVLVGPHLSFAGFQLFEFSLLNRTFVFPFMVWALIFFLRGQTIRAFLLLGLMYNLHVLSVNFVLAMLLFDCLLEWRKVHWGKMALGLLGFAVAALPVLIWKMEGPPVDLTLRPEWLDILSRGILHNVFYMVGPLSIWLLTLSGVGGLALFFIGYRYAPALHHQRTMLHFVLAVLLVLGVEVVTAYWFPVTIIVQCQIIRIGFWGVLFGYLYFANYLAQAYRVGHVAPFDWWVLAGTCAAAPLAFPSPVIWAVQQSWQRNALGQRAVAFISPILIFVLLGEALSGNIIWKPGIYLYGPNTAWEDTQRWAKANTPQDARFITPPHKWGFYDSEWRVFSERSTVSTLSELLEAAFVPAYIDYWRPRFDALAPGTIDQLSGDYFTDIQKISEAFYGLSDTDLYDVAERYGASYVVIEKPHLRPWPVAYENEAYVIYRVSQAP